MNLKAAGLVAAGVAGVAGLAVLGGCAAKNQDKTSEGVAGDYINRYDKNSDQKLDVEFETTRDVPGSQCLTYIDTNNDGFAGFGDSCLVTDNYVDRYTVAALVSRADNMGNKDGKADMGEIAAIVREFDTGSADGKAIAGNNILEKAEIQSFNKSYDDARGQRIS